MQKLFPAIQTNCFDKILQIIVDNSSIISIFSGSATTAHAVMQLNAEDGGKRKYISVQLPQPLYQIVKPTKLVTKISVK